MTTRRSQLAARRRQRGLSQERLAELVGVSRGAVARWERGEGDMFARQRVGLAEALDVTLGQLDQLLVRDGSPVAVSLTSLPEQPVDLKQLTLQALADYRRRDSRSGGRGLYDEVLGFLSETLSPHCFGVFDSRRADVFSAAASVCEMAGWMAFEADLPELAGRHFDRAHDLSSLSGDSQLSAHISASRSHLATETGLAKQAGALARSGQDELASGQPAPELHAKLLVYEARSCARAGEADRSRTLMREAEGHLAVSTFKTDSPWLSPFDEASLANETAKCCVLIGDYSESIRQAQDVLDSRPPGRARSRVFAYMSQAQAFAALGELDEARSVAGMATEEAASLQSAPIDRRLSAVADLLAGPPS